MARRSSSPPLYELISTARRKGAGDAAPPPPPTSAPEPEPAPGQRLSPGQAIRVPVGYLFLATAGVLLVAIFAYMTGHHRGGEAMRAEYDQVIVDAQSGRETARSLRDPLAAARPRARPADRLAEPPSVMPAGAEPAPDDPGTAVDAEPSWGPLDSDPRRRGLHYLVLATTRPEGADRLARFCRESGLEAYVIDGNNPRRRRVIVLPGFSTRSRNDPAVRAVRDRVEAVGRRWKGEHRGESDLSDVYMSLFEG